MALFCQKSERMSDSLICLFLVSDLSDLLMIAHSFWATWANRSRLLICHERPERCSHFAQKECFLLFLTTSKKTFKTYKSLIFSNRKWKWAICSKKPSDLLICYLSWASWANWSHSLICSEQFEQIPNLGFVPLTPKPPRIIVKNSVLDPDLYWIRIQELSGSESVFGIRIWISTCK